MDGLRDSDIANIPAELGGEKVVLGFDGYVDRIREIVNDGPDQEISRRVHHLAELGEQISAAARAERSLLLKWTTPNRRVGGHTCHISRVLEQLAYDPVMIGMFGQPPNEIFREDFRGSELESLGDPAYTDAIEFDDWKFMLTEAGGMQFLDWTTLSEEVGFDRLATHLDGAALLSIGYWAEISDLHSILEGLHEELLPSLDSPPKHVLVDPGNIGKRPNSVVQRGGEMLSRLDEQVPVTVSANQFETEDIAALSGSTGGDRSQMETAAKARAELGVTRFVTHRATRSVLVTDSEQVSIGVPQTDNPVSTTGVGDYFNAGIIMGLILELPPHETVALGNAIAGYFVRQGSIPTTEDLNSFLRSYSIENWRT